MLSCIGSKPLEYTLHEIQEFIIDWKGSERRWGRRGLSNGGMVSGGSTRTKSHDTSQRWWPLGWPTGNESDTKPTLQPRPSSLRLLHVTMYEKQPRGNQIPVNRGVETGIGKLPEGTTEEGLWGVFQEWERRMQKCVDVGGNYFEGDKVL